MFIMPNQSRYLLEDPRRIYVDSMIWLHGKQISTDKQKNDNISKASVKRVNFQFFLGQHLFNLHAILVSGFHGNHCQKTKYIALWKIFNKPD